MNKKSALKIFYQCFLLYFTVSIFWSMLHMTLIHPWEAARHNVVDPLFDAVGVHLHDITNVTDIAIILFGFLGLLFAKIRPYLFKVIGCILVVNVFSTSVQALFAFRWCNDMFNMYATWVLFLCWIFFTLS